MLYDYKGILPKIDKDCFLAPGCAIVGEVSLRSGVNVWFNAVIRGDMATINIGENSNIQDGVLVHCIANIPVIIGQNVTIGHGAILHSCTIADGCLIGMGSILLDHVKVGKNSLIAAGSVVPPKMEIPEGSLVMGSPAKIKRQLTMDEVEHLKKSALSYVALSQEYEMQDKIPIKGIF